MPVVSDFYGLKVQIYYNDNDKHHKPHVHVLYGEHEASIGIDGELLAGHLPSKQLRVIDGWIALHEDELYTQWNNAVAGKVLSRIAPLK